MAYALGKFAKGLCDRCAFEYKLSELREEWNGAKVCPDCYEPKHPQLEPLTATADPESLYRPRPNNDHEEGEGFVVVVQSNIFRPDYLNTSTLPTNFTVSEMTANVGEVTIVT
jgi:NAD-dependent SIR2 family protein deacetylase